MIIDWRIDMTDLILDLLSNTIELMKHIGPLFGVLIIMLESIIPILPLGVFVALNIFAYGSVLGFVISWLSTIAGCLISFYLFRKGFRKILWIKIENKERLVNAMNYISNVKLYNVVLLIALPFTPAFLINIIAGLSKIPVKRFLVALLIGKLSVIYFWGYIGTTIIESVSNPSIIIKITVMLLIAYIISKIISKKLEIE
jgi:uncharacterized membrane protein YdjX (TVP38/TMEM64 family)